MLFSSIRIIRAVVWVWIFGIFITFQFAWRSSHKPEANFEVFQTTWDWRLTCWYKRGRAQKQCTAGEQPENQQRYGLTSDVDELHFGYIHGREASIPASPEETLFMPKHRTKGTKRYARDKPKIKSKATRCLVGLPSVAKYWLHQQIANRCK